MSTGGSETATATTVAATTTGGSAATGGSQGTSVASSATGGSSVANFTGTGGATPTGGAATTGGTASVTNDCSPTDATVGKPCCQGLCSDPNTTVCDGLSTTGSNKCLHCGDPSEPCCNYSTCNAYLMPDRITMGAPPKCPLLTPDDTLPMCPIKAYCYGAVHCYCFSNGTCNAGLTCTGPNTTCAQTQ